MSADNKLLVRKWFDEVWNKGRAEAIDELLPAETLVHNPDADLRGPEGFKPFHAAFRQAFPDVRIRILEEIAEGDLVAVRWECTATHRGEGLGFSPTARPVRVSGMSIVCIRDGSIVEGWNNFDQLGMLQQLGAVKHAMAQ